MAYLPYQMDGNGNLRLPIIDILQTINSSPFTRQNSKLENSRTNLLHYDTIFVKKDQNKNCAGLLKSKINDKSIISQSFCNRENIFKKTGINKPCKKNAALKTKLSLHKSSISARERNFILHSNRLLKKKSSQFLFEAAKSIDSFKKNKIVKEDSSFTSIRKVMDSFLQLKRKNSFVDYIRLKKNYEVKNK